ncbi:hypothetical protein C2845_PM13G25600 [Panicum miliaceum]|uniref:Phosphatidylinositol N-acetylglucosaminyltransferase subunit Q n=1 Tax=Panicum miliaceum TaxID=4540 RepID=A0A3L6RN54_PANMI|nr:hypothetical protein C2845_PM13G25600 [Panicum miliaceum]
MAIERCRIWWPRQELQLEQGPVPARLVLFGWFFTGGGSLDIVISAAVPEDQILRSFATLDTLQVILYEVPTFGRNHFSLGVDAPRELKASFRKPSWINDLQKQPSFLDLLDCQSLRNALPAALGLISSLHLLFRKCLSHMSQYLMLHKVFKHSWNNIQLRSCQILYWPIVLRDTSLSSTVNVEYAHKAAIRKHALWSSIAVDLLMGFVLGAVFLLNTETICIWTIALVHHMTDAILRSGCVWLMGVPAGFKLNTELAELLGTISLNAVQIYSTLWFFVGAYLRRIIEGIAFSGIILGLTAPVSFFIDIIQLATLHVTMLHWLISSVYSRQIQTVASLWRLFRGRKWNPLRQRLDSYDYTVEQHVVGSLLFTPVLLLIPTTSVFYVFFSILTTMVIWVCVMLEIAIAVIQSTHYAELTLWVTRRQRFPAGIFFLHVPSSTGRTFEDDDLSSHPIRGCNERKTKDTVDEQSESLVSELNCNYATLVQVIRSNYERVFNRTGFSFCKQLAYGILSGERVPSSLHLQPSLSFPWMNIGITEYWMRCRDSVLSCASKSKAQILPMSVKLSSWNFHLIAFEVRASCVFMKEKESRMDWRSCSAAKMPPSIKPHLHAEEDMRTTMRRAWSLM